MVLKTKRDWSSKNKRTFTSQQSWSRL